MRIVIAGALAFLSFAAAPAWAQGEHPACAPFRATWTNLRAGSDLAAMDRHIATIPGICAALRTQAQRERTAAQTRLASAPKSNAPPRPGGGGDPETVFFQAARTCADWRAYTQAWPDGRYRALVNNRLAEPACAGSGSSATRPAAPPPAQPRSTGLSADGASLVRAAIAPESVPFLEAHARELSKSFTPNIVTTTTQSESWSSGSGAATPNVGCPSLRLLPADKRASNTLTSNATSTSTMSEPLVDRGRSTNGGKGCGAGSTPSQSSSDYEYISTGIASISARLISSGAVYQPHRLSGTLQLNPAAGRLLVELTQSFVYVPSSPPTYNWSYRYRCEEHSRMRPGEWNAAFPWTVVRLACIQTTEWTAAPNSRGTSSNNYETHYVPELNRSFSFFASTQSSANGSSTYSGGTPSTNYSTTKSTPSDVVVTREGQAVRIKYRISSDTTGTYASRTDSEQDILITPR